MSEGGSYEEQVYMMPGKEIYINTFYTKYACKYNKKTCTDQTNNLTKL